jgi:membrane-associated phospholipid phosphatase
VLLGPALLLGAVAAVVVRRSRGDDPAGGRAVAIAALLVGGIVLGILTVLVSTDAGVLGLDRTVAPWGHDHTTPFARWMLDFVTSFGTMSAVVAIAVGVFVVEMIRSPSRWLPVFLVAVVAGQKLLSDELKDLVDRARPAVNPIAHTLGPAFPSGHTAAAAASFAAIALVLGRGRARDVRSLLAAGAMFAAVAVAASRVLLGVHWLSDVIGGLALGWAWFAACSLALGGRLLRPATPIAASSDPLPRA